MSFDIDALLGETEDKPLTYKREVFVLPGELPGAVLAPFLDKELGLPQIVADAIAAAEDSDKEQDGAGWVKTILSSIATRPDLPLDVLHAAHAALTELLEAGGEGQAEKFFALRPSVPAYIVIATNIAVEYGVGLADFFFSSESSETGGEGSKQTSPTTTPDSTPEGSGDTPPAEG